MKKVILFGASMAVSALTACHYTSPAAGIANPASEFCIKQGGKSEIRKDKDGSEYGVCHLPNGETVEEWEYFRRHHQL
ncbi:DUF333 domain-containing protein [Actinobacillus succinogenes]|uniref:Hemolysin n=1 Tax=Actinobacillus succinogenes (strain ATCC 55618 / DSM 22257 / CCUG 43843 / 130Z) TaxID=339671 RepID=A6VPT5_ACTSZ|nr:DUF333 domain-containing protein [Actinobacillus succinogenes]ABR74982.1 protein of unknown function DUF333 [Actinobacillus succinogenes 130Z]PHI40610.1 DUF333 domain-containing protein [Actinobacillus succinogenes]